MRCSCIDFDNKLDKHPDPKWREKAELMYFLLSSLGLSCLFEISQSGAAAHIWLFFKEPTDAWIPRAFWRVAAAKLNIAGTIESYPRQDVLAGGKGIGNLVRYPLWNKSRFIDPDLDGVEVDPVAALNGVQTVAGEDLKLVSFQSGLGELTPDRRLDVVASIEGNIPLRVAKLLDRESTLLRRRWDNDSAGMQDRSRSAVAMSIVCELVRAFVPTPEIASALWAWVRKHDPDGKYHRDTWINATIAKAYDFVTEKREVRSSTVTTMREAAHQAIDQIERGELLYIPSGIADLDRSIDGIAPGEVLVLAGRPSHGKSAIAFQWISNAAAMGIKGLVISEEMGAIEIGRRRLQSISRIPSDQWVPASCASLRRDVDSHHKNKADVYIVESCNTVDRAEEIIDQMCSLYDVGFVAIDYLQLLGGRGTNRQEQVSEVSRRIKQATRRNMCCTMLLSQLNRAVESRDDFMPQMSDLRESGSIEQDADLIVFGVYPHKVNAKEFPPDLYRLVCAKRRNGPTRQPLIETTFNPSRQIIGFEDSGPELD